MNQNNDYSNITTKELSDRADKLSSKAEEVKQNILKQCNELDLFYKELVTLKEELQARTKQ